MKINKYWEKPKKRYNKTYKGTLTKRRKEINTNRAFAILVMWCIFATTYCFAMTSNSFKINGAVVAVEELNSPSGLYSNEAETASLVEQESVAVINPVVVSLPVMIETEKSNEMQIREIAKEFDFQWTDWLIRLAKCESGLNEKISNNKGNTPAGSTDRGIFQINDYWHSEVSNKCSYDLRCSTIWTMQRVNAGYQSEWVCNSLI